MLAISRVGYVAETVMRTCLNSSSRRRVSSKIRRWSWGRRLYLNRSGIGAVALNFSSG
jgi:hypothetical protein